MRAVTVGLILDVIGRRQPVTEGRLADELGAAAPVPEVLRNYLTQLELSGRIQRNNDRQFSLKEPEPMPPPVEKTRACSRCKTSKPPEEMTQGGLCKACKKIANLEYREKKKAGARKSAKPAKASPRPRQVKITPRQDHFAAVLADLQARRRQLDAAIAAIEELDSARTSAHSAH